MPDGGRKRIGGRNAEMSEAKRAGEVQTEVRAEGKGKCEPGKPGKVRDGRKHGASAERADSLGRCGSRETGRASERSGVKRERAR